MCEIEKFISRLKNMHPSFSILQLNSCLKCVDASCTKMGTSHKTGIIGNFIYLLEHRHTYVYITYYDDHEYHVHKEYTY